MREERRNSVWIFFGVYAEKKLLCDAYLLQNEADHLSEYTILQRGLSIHRDYFPGNMEAGKILLFYLCAYSAKGQPFSHNAHADCLKSRIFLYYSAYTLISSQNVVVKRIFLNYLTQSLITFQKNCVKWCRLWCMTQPIIIFPSRFSKLAFFFSTVASLQTSMVVEILACPMIS